jgi:ABC-type transport system involved in multi-copper enzyme maturation permease subunit
MIRLPMILAIARAEIRSVRRLIRYWMFSVLSVLITFLIYMYYSALHGFVSRLSATIGATGPRYLMSAMGLYILVIFLLGLIFLAFDVRARDERERIAEVLDSRPMSNVELLVGRSVGLVLMAWAPVLFVAVALQAFGSLALMFDWYLGEPVEPWSLLGFTLDTLTVFSLWCGIIVLLAVLVRNRMLVAIAALVLLGLNFWGMFRMPIYLQPVLMPFGNFGMASDLVPSLAVTVNSLQRVSMWILTAGLIALAAAFHPRPDGGSKSRKIAVGGGLVAVTAIIITLLTVQANAGMDVRETWLAAHEEHRDDPRADVQSITGTVRIDPGTNVGLDLEIRVLAPADRRLETLLFTFNPGFDVDRVSVGGTDASFTHESGLLEITPSNPLLPGAETVIELTTSGKPDTTFGYLDAERNPLAGTLIDSGIFILGVDVGVFKSPYVALMPGLGWLPHSGSDVPAGDPRTHPSDYFEVDLEVEVPDGWLVAGPGRRQVLDSDGERARFRFRPGAPVPHVGLLASRFDRRSMEVAGVELEILVHPKHLRNLKFFEDAAGEIESRIEELLTDAEKLGLPYPYGGLTLVESPTNLRGYGGGWRMDTTQAMPGVLLLRENSFTTSRFEFEFRNPEDFDEREGGMARAKVEAVERFFENDFSGGNVFLGGSRNFLLFQTGAHGEGALALDFVLDELVNQLLTGKRGYFSAFLFDQKSSFVIGETIINMLTGQTESIAEAVLKAASDRPSVWDLALGTSMAALEPTEDAPQSLNVLALKSRAIALSILDGLGREKTAALLSELLSRYRGGHFTGADFHQIAVELDASLEPLIGDWLNEATLPGFITSPVVIERLADDDQGNPRYQTRVHVLNDESTPGLLRMSYLTGEEGTRENSRQLTEPVRLAGHESVEIGLLSSTPPQELWLQPYLSLNRQEVQLSLPRVDQEEEVEAEPFLGHRPSDWRPFETADIVIDDLDEGFSVESAEEESGTRLRGGLASFFVPPVDMDQGLPEFSQAGLPPKEWSRRETPSSWGKYRHTIALVSSGSGDHRAIFKAELPHSGRWRLAYYLPELTRMANTSIRVGGARIDGSIGLAGSLGTYDLTLVAGGQEQTLEFDGEAAEVGWNSLGEFDLAQGEARVEVSNETSGRLVIADAIRWQSVSETP